MVAGLRFRLWDAPLPRQDEWASLIGVRLSVPGKNVDKNLGDMYFTCFVGVGESKVDGMLEMCVSIGGEVVDMTMCRNEAEDIKASVEAIKSGRSLENDDILICAEYDGYRPSELVRACGHNGYILCTEIPSRVGFNMGKEMGKASPSYRMAQYALRFLSRLRVSRSPDEDIIYLGKLSEARALCLWTQRKYYERLGTPGNGAYADGFEAMGLVDVSLVDALADIEGRIERAIDSSVRLSHQMELLESIDGVDHGLALRVVAVTMGFTRFDTPKQFSNYAYLTPDHKQLDSKNPDSLERCDVRDMLRIAARAAVDCKSGDLYAFYARKVAEGKNEDSVINALATKMVLRMFAVIRSDRPYDPDFDGGSAEW